MKIFKTDYSIKKHPLKSSKTSHQIPFVRLHSPLSFSATNQWNSHVSLEDYPSVSSFNRKSSYSRLDTVQEIGIDNSKLLRVRLYPKKKFKSNRAKARKKIIEVKYFIIFRHLKSTNSFSIHKRGLILKSFRSIVMTSH